MLNRFIDGLCCMFGWVFSVFLVLLGFLFLIDALTPINAGTLSKSMSSIIIIICGFLINPSFIKYMKNKNILLIINNKKYILLTFFIIALITFNLGDFLKNKEAEELILKDKISLYQNNKTEIISIINNFINNKEYENAITEIKKYSYIKDEKLDILFKKAKIQMQLDTQSQMQKEHFENEKQKQKILLNELYEKLPLISEDDHLKNIRTLEMIEEIEPLSVANKSILENHKEKQKVIDELDRKKKEREDLISSYFSAWDGSCYILEKFIKNNMNDPDSYKHVETRYIEKGDYLIVRTKYRGKNAFGGTVTNHAAIKIDLVDKKITVIE